MQHNYNTDTRKLSWWDGAVAGCIGTGPMTAFMLITQRFLPKGQRYALPPEIIIAELAHRFHIKHHMNKGLLVWATTLAHFGYGAAVGTLYIPLGKGKLLPVGIKGALCGLLVWAGSYLVLLPLLGMRESGHREPPHRNMMMVAAHLVWGAATVAVADILTRDK